MPLPDYVVTNPNHSAGETTVQPVGRPRPLLSSTVARPPLPIGSPVTPETPHSTHHSSFLFPRLPASQYATALFVTGRPRAHPLSRETESYVGQDSRWRRGFGVMRRLCSVLSPPTPLSCSPRSTLVSSLNPQPDAILVASRPEDSCGFAMKDRC